VPVWRARDITLADLTPKLEACFSFGTSPPDIEAFVKALANLESQSIASLMRLM
jgi:hypothetical protein